MLEKSIQKLKAKMENASKSQKYSHSELNREIVDLTEVRQSVSLNSASPLTSCRSHGLALSFQEVSQSQTPYWRREELRNQLKPLKKTLDNIDKARKAAVLNEVGFFG